MANSTKLLSPPPMHQQQQANNRGAAGSAGGANNSHYSQQQPPASPNFYYGQSIAGAGNRIIHSKMAICTIFMSFIIYIASLVVIFLVQNKKFTEITIKDVSSNAKYKLLITPVDVTFQIWMVIYSMLFLLHVYSIANICRRGKVGYLYISPGLVSKKLLFLLTISYILMTGWVILFTMHDKLGSMAYSTTILILLALNNLLALFHAQSRNKKALCRVSPQMSFVCKRENILYQFIVVNTLALFFGWTLVAANLGLGILAQEYFVNRADEKQPSFDLAMQISFAILLSLVLTITLYTLLDYSFLSMTSFTVFAYFAFTVAIVGIYFNNSAQNATQFASQYPGSSQESSASGTGPATFQKEKYLQIILALVVTVGFVKIILSICALIRYAKRN